MAIVQWFCVILALSMVGGTLLNLHSSPHWFVRGWDFPRLQIAGLALLGAVPYAIWFADWRWYDMLLIGSVGLAVVWQLWRVLPYTKLWPRQVVSIDSDEADHDNRVRLVMTNVQAENDRYDLWRQVVDAADPDVIIAVEVNDAWLEVLQTLRPSYPMMVARPQDNYFGIAVLSRLELVDPQVRFVVEDDVPSIHTHVRLRSGEAVRLVAVHPRPPEPVRNQDATPRDAELVVIGRELEKTGGPAVIVGDLNDVAWSRTTELFMRVSSMLDPRRGRGMYNSWNAKNPMFRFPLDHVFHTDQFRLVDLHRLDAVGSDHFPMLIDLQYDAAAAAEQPAPTRDNGDEAMAQRRVEQEEQCEDRPIQSNEAH